MRSTATTPVRGAFGSRGPFATMTYFHGRYAGRQLTILNRCHYQR